MNLKKDKKPELDDNSVEKQAESLQKKERERDKKNRVTLVSHNRVITVVVTMVICFGVAFGGIYMTGHFKKSGKYLDIDALNNSSNSTTSSQTVSSNSPASSSKRTTSVDDSKHPVSGSEQTGIIPGYEYHPINGENTESGASSGTQTKPGNTGIHYIEISPGSTSGTSRPANSESPENNGSGSDNNDDNETESYSDMPVRDLPPARSTPTNTFRTPASEPPPSDGTPFEIP